VEDVEKVERAPVSYAAYRAWIRRYKEECGEKEDEDEEEEEEEKVEE
jgi:hypothetical protein